MATFDFVVSDEFRACLEKDAEELVLCMKGGAWKAAHVMASSLIQAALTEYLSSSGLALEEPLSRMPLNQLLELCRREQVLTARTVELAAFLRPYSDFLSPVQAVRLEAATDETGARIAQALLEIIVNEIASHRREVYQYSADKVVSKVLWDPSAMTIAGHLLQKLSRTELERLLTDLIPKAYFEAARSGDASAAEALPRLEACFRLAMECAPQDLKRVAAEKFLSVLENESEFVVQTWQSAFFRATDLEHLEESERATIKTHFLASLSKPLTPGILNAATGMGAFLSTEEETRAFFVPLVMALVQSSEDALSAAVLRRICEEFGRLPAALRKSVGSWIGRLRWSLAREGRQREATVLAGLEAALPKAAV